MRSREFVIESAKLWSAKVRINQPNYVGYVDAQVWAPNAQIARTILKQQYQIQDHHVGSVKELKTKQVVKESVDFEQMQPQQIVAVAQDAFGELYPDVKLYGKSVVEGVGLTTAKGQAGAASAFAGSDTVRGAFYLTVNAYAEGDAMIVVVEDATAGNYKGAATAVIKSLFEAGERLYKTQQRELVINDNANVEAWSVIADRVGAEMMESQNLAEQEQHNFTTAYHITTEENAGEIADRGLRPSDGEVYLVVDQGDPKKLKAELYEVAHWMYARIEDSDEDLNLLKVDVSDIPLTYKDGWYRSSTPISADRIENLGSRPLAGL
jgi:hypothetical protein